MSRTRSSICRVDGQEIRLNLKPLDEGTKSFRVVSRDDGGRIAGNSTSKYHNRKVLVEEDGEKEAAGDAHDEEPDKDEGMFDRYGFRCAEGDTGSSFHRSAEVSDTIAKKRREKEASRLLKWSEMLSAFKSTQPSKVEAALAKLKERTRKGIPNDRRGEAWYYICGAKEVLKEIPDPEACMTGSDGKCVVPARTLDEIERDIDRTYPAHRLFRTKDSKEETPKQKSLRKVLRWYAAVDPEVGYCQGMGFLAGLFLLYMDELSAFQCFYKAMQMNSEITLRDLYLPQMVEAQRVLFVFKKLGRQHLPRLWIHLEAQQLDPTMYATEWAMTMFCRGFHFDLVTRVMDIYLNEGYKVVFRVMLALMKNVEETLTSSSFEQIMDTLRKIPELTDVNVIMDIAYNIRVKRADITKYAAEYDGMKREERKSLRL
jgi:hypothetical protein